VVSPRPATGWTAPVFSLGAKSSREKHHTKAVAVTRSITTSDLEAALRSVHLDPQFLWTAIRCTTEDRLREELAYVLDSRAPPDTFVAPGVAAGGGRRADIGEQRDGLIPVAIEMKHVWGSDPRWKLNKSTRKAVDAYPVGVKAQSVLHAVMMYEGARAREASTELGIVLLAVVHVHTDRGSVAEGPWSVLAGNALALSEQDRRVADRSAWLTRSSARSDHPGQPRDRREDTGLLQHSRDVCPGHAFGIASSPPSSIPGGPKPWPSAPRSRGVTCIEAKWRRPGSFSWPPAMLRGAVGL
jgi:hypothetical protein